MKNITHILRILIAIFTSVFSFAFLNSCSGNKVNAGGSSVYANPDSIQYNKENYAFMLRYSYATFGKTTPQSALNKILDSATDEDAKVAYEDAIDTFVDDGSMTDGWKKYAQQALGIGSEESDSDERYPANLFAYVVTSGKPMSEFLTANYAIDDSGKKVSQGSQWPSNEQAGYFTIQRWMEQYSPNSFGFRMAREILGFNFCDSAPFTRVTLFSWTESQLNVKYRVSGGLQCSNCHKNFNPVRGAFHKMRLDGLSYDSNNSQDSNQYDQEENAGDGSTLEPRNADDTPMDAMTAQNSMYKLTSNGVALTSPHVLATEIVKNDRYDACMVERFFSVFFNTEQGHPGPGYIAPNNFADNEAQVAYLKDWTDKFREANEIPKEFFRIFLKDKSYLVLSYSPETN